MDFFEVVESRRSVRKYKDDPVPEEVIKNALQAAIKAPNSSNLQPWEFYWVRSPDKKAALVKACLSQSAASTAKELIVAVARTDTWRRNRKLMLDIVSSNSSINGGVVSYYKKLIPFVYTQGFFNVIGYLKRFIGFISGLFTPVPRGPNSHSELLNVVTKTTALACENFMLAISAQGFGTCPMEGFDEVRVKDILKLPYSKRAHVVMVISVGVPDPKGIYGERIRFDDKLFLFEV